MPPCVLQLPEDNAMAGGSILLPGGLDEGSHVTGFRLQNIAASIVSQPGADAKRPCAHNVVTASAAQTVETHAVSAKTSKLAKSATR